MTILNMSYNTLKTNSMKANFNIPLVGINGKTVKFLEEGQEYDKEKHSSYPDKMLGTELAYILGAKKEGDSRKIGGWHKVLLTGKALELDKSDLRTLSDMIEEDKDIFIFFKSQILDVLDNAK